MGAYFLSEGGAKDFALPPPLAEVPFKGASTNYLQFPMVPTAELPSKRTFERA